MEIAFNELSGADLIVDCIYKGGSSNNISDEVLHHLFPKCGTSGGFRKVNRDDGSGKPAYVILYTSMEELEWPDYLDVETGIFRYYGDNRLPGRDLTDTKLKGNELLEQVFGWLNAGDESWKDIPPFFVFKKTGNGRDVKFLGLAAPGNPKLSPDKDLIAFWRTINGNRFQNYEAYFTILNTGSVPISREWISNLIYNHDSSTESAPKAWKKFISQGRNGIDPLQSPKIVRIPTREDQLQMDSQGLISLDAIRKRYNDNPFGFERCATDIVCKMDPNFVDFSLTRPWRDGGRDALGFYVISQQGNSNYPLKIDCALEAKCYSPSVSVGVREMSRLISRIRYRQFGIMVTTSYVHNQAYKEVIEDGHPILIVTATDIASILRKSSIYPFDVNDWLDSLDSQ